MIGKKLKKILKKIYKKDKIRYEATLKKIDEIINAENPHHYKNLSNSMREFKRVHIDSHFVLIFKIENDAIKFENLQHHDYIYN
ncbi:MAG: addiction module toxin RelE [archaeon]